MVTDGAHNIVASVTQLNIRHIYCFAHMLNLIVKKSVCQTSELENIRSRARKIVGTLVGLLPALHTRVYRWQKTAIYRPNVEFF